MKRATTANLLRPVIQAPAMYKGQETRHVDALSSHPENPRDEIDPESQQIIEMAGSINKNGIIEPLVITPGNVLLAGHRRRTASRVAARLFNRTELLYVPVVVRDIPPENALEFMLQENMQRQDLNPVEEARAIYRIKEKRNLNVADLARHLELSPAIISQLLPILTLPPEVQALYASFELPLGAAPFLSRVATAEKQISYAGLLARRQLNVERFKKLAAKDFGPQPPPSAPRVGEPPFTPERARLTAVPRTTRQGKKIKSGPGPGQQLAPTRADAMADLSRALNRKISMVTVKAVIEATCCACGMSGDEACCRVCPLPRIIKGLVGRTEG